MATGYKPRHRDHRYTKSPLPHAEGYKRLDQLQYGDVLLLQSAEGAWPATPAYLPMPYGVRGALAGGMGGPAQSRRRRMVGRVGRSAGLCGRRWLCPPQRQDATCLGLAISDQDADLAELQRIRYAWFGSRGNNAAPGSPASQYDGMVASFLPGLGLTIAGQRRSAYRRASLRRLAMPWWDSCEGCSAPMAASRPVRQRARAACDWQPPRSGWRKTYSNCC